MPGQIVSGEFLQRHGGFRLERLPYADTERTRRSIEPPARAGCGRTIDIALQHGLHRLRCTASRLRAKPLGDLAIPSERVEQRRRHAPRLPRCQIAAGKRDGSQVPEPAPLRAIDPKQFSTPRRTVVTEPDAVERDPDDRFTQSMFRNDCRDMGVMMLHGDRRNTDLRGQALREVRTEEVGMQVMRHGIDS